MRQQQLSSFRPAWAASLLIVLVISADVAGQSSANGVDSPVTPTSPLAVLVVGTHHYSPQMTMPVFAKELERVGFRTAVVSGEGDPEKKTQNVLPGIEQLNDADVAIFFMRFLRLPDEEWQVIERYIESGKPVVGLRTANHSFKYPQDHQRYEWNDGFGRRVLGTPYIVHQSGTTKVEVVEKYSNSPILSYLPKTAWTSPGTLYLTRLEAGCRPLLIGRGQGRSRLMEKDFGVIQVNESEADIVAWTWKNEWNAKVFATTLGHPGDFAEESTVRLLVNGVCWAGELPIPVAGHKMGTWDGARKTKR